MAREGHTEIVNALIKAEADVNAKGAKGYSGWTALMWAGNAEIVNALIQAGAEVNAKVDNGMNVGMTALMFAASMGHTETVNALIEAGADDLTDKNGWTALIYATAVFHCSNHETVNALIDAGSNVKYKEHKGRTALYYARNNPRLEGTDALERLEELSR